MRLTKSLPLYLLTWLLNDAVWLLQAAEPVMAQYVLVERVPRAITETLMPLPGAGIAYCARACHANRDTCQGFHLISGQTHPCVLLEELTGMTDAPNVNIRAFVNTYFEGTRHQYWKMTNYPWDRGVADCQSAGMIMVSYPKSEKKLNWLNAINPGLLHIGAQKDPVDPSKVYDINTNELILVDWALGPGGASSSAVCLMSAYKQFGRGYPWGEYPNIGLLCSEAN